MTKIIIIFGLLLLIVSGYVFYQFSFNQHPTKQVTIANCTFSAEVVTKTKEQQIGLTKYASLSAKKAMLFTFSKADTHPFWMRNMKFPIDILFLKENVVVGVVANAQPAKATDKNIPTYGDNIASDAVIEIGAGLVKKYGIKEGTKVTIK